MIAILALAVLPQTTWFVDAAAVAPGDGTIASPFTRIGYAASQATTVDGDTLLVGPGVYLDERVQLGAKGLTITGDGGPGSIVLVAPSSGSILTGDAPTTPVSLTNLTFRGGRGDVSTSHGGRAGGAIRASYIDLNIDGCVFEDCEADYGGAIATESFGTDLGQLIIRNSEFRDSCVAAIDGGAIHNTNGRLRVFDSTVRGHATSGRGGAVFSEGVQPALRREMHFLDTLIQGTAYGDGGAVYTYRTYPGFERCTVEGRCLGDGRGGAVHAWSVAFSDYRDSTFRGSRALWGGAIFGHNLRISGCRFEDNATWSPLQPEPGGGGALCSTDTAIIENSVFFRNRASHHPRAAGGAIYGPASTSHSTLVDNDASLDGAALFSFPTSHGVQHLRMSIVLRVEGSTTPLFNVGTVARRNIVEDGYPAHPNNRDVDPMFWGPSDFHLLPGSPAAAPTTSGLHQGAFPYDPYWCGEGCDGSIGLVSCVAMPNSTGSPAQISALGSTDPSVDRVVLLMSELPGQPLGVVLASQSAAFTPHAGGGAGTLCLGGSILRFPTEPLTYTGGVVSYRPVLSNLPQGAVVQAGESWFFQFWYRDTSTAGPTSNLTPALYIGF